MVRFQTPAPLATFDCHKILENIISTLDSIKAQIKNQFDPGVNNY